MPLVNKMIGLLFLFSSGVMASEKAAPEAVHGAAAEKEYSGKQTQEWSEVQTKLSALKGKVDAQENIVKALIHEKKPGSDAEVATRIELLKKEHAKLQSLIADYNKMSASYETRFPEKGLKESRIYRRVDPQAIQLDETASTYEERLRILQNKIMRQYPKAAQQIQSAKKRKEEAQKKSSKSQKSDEQKQAQPKHGQGFEPKAGEVTDQIILQK